jgi:hypothetical protein
MIYEDTVKYHKHHLANLEGIVPISMYHTVIYVEIECFKVAQCCNMEMLVSYLYWSSLINQYGTKNTLQFGWST